MISVKILVIVMSLAICSQSIIWRGLIKFNGTIKLFKKIEAGRTLSKYMYVYVFVVC